jgi:hypothetical protein
MAFMTHELHSPSLTVDHAAHFVPDIDGAGAALETLGFTLTPFSAQSVQPENNGAPGALVGEPVPAGTGNRCVMLQRGYIEILAPTHDTPNANRLRAAISRYTGVHLIAFGSKDGNADYARLAQEGFRPLPPIALQREVGTVNGAEAGTSTARFTVVRVPPGIMAEGRIQYCQHHTPELVWQPRWIKHRNNITGLAGVILCVADAEEAAQRHARFTGLPARRVGNTWRLDTARGTLFFLTPLILTEKLGIAAPTVPWIAGTVLETSNFDLTMQTVRDAGTAVRALAEHCMLIELPQALGGIMIVQREGGREIHDIL